MKVSHWLLRRNVHAWILSSLLIFLWRQPAHAQINNWLSSSSGDWESPQWSFGLPSFYEDIFITNAGVKTIVIEQVTTEYHPSILNIEGLTLSAPAGSSNTLFMNYAGLESPLSMANLSVGPDCAVVMDGSALDVTNALGMDGTLTQDKSSTVTTYALDIGTKNSATYYLDSGTLTAYEEYIGVYFPAQFLQQAGTNTSGVVGINAGSEYTLMSGELDGFVRVSAGATFKMETGLCNSAFSVDGSFIQSGGIITDSGEGMTLPILGTGGHLAGATGDAVQTGGTNIQTSITIGASSYGGDGGSYTLSNGWLIAQSESVLCDGGITQTGGVHIIQSVLNIQGAYKQDSVYPGIAAISISPATYELGKGLISASNLTVGIGGSFVQNGGTNIVSGTLDFATVLALLGPNGGTSTTISGIYSLNDGLLSVSNLNAVAQSGFSQSGGKLIAQNVVGDEAQSGGTAQIGNLSGNYSLSGGLLVATNLTVSNSVFQHTGGTCTLLGNITLDNGTWQERTPQQAFNQLQLGAGTNSIIQFPTNACNLQFADSSSLTWSNAGVLTIVNWNGSTNGSGTNVIQFGADAFGLNAQQLGQIQFANPAGLPAGNYLATMLPNGEIVPGSPSYLGTAPAPFFTGEASQGGDWYYLAGSNHVFGYFYLADFPYVYHLDMGWEYFEDAANGVQGGYFYDFTDGIWFYTQPSLFPYLYDFTANAWQYYEPVAGTPGHYTSNPRWFYNFSTQTWGNHL